MTFVRKAYLGLLWLALAGTVVQFFLAGIGIFGGGFGAHETLGIILHLPVAALLLILALVAIRPLSLMGLAVLFSIVLFFQPFWTEFDASGLAALHVVFPLVILGLGGYLERRTRALIGATAAPTPARAQPAA